MAQNRGPLINETMHRPENLRCYNFARLETAGVFWDSWASDGRLSLLLHFEDKAVTMCRKEHDL